MAKDVITRFKLETTQFDSKIKNTAKELSDIGKSASAAGKDFDKLTKDSIDAARSFGSMATSMTDAKGKTKELVSAFNDLAKTYNALNKEQQQSDFGKAVSASLTQLQQRIKETKQEMQSISSSSGGLFGSDKLDGMLQVFGGNLMTKGASLLTGLVSDMGEMVKQGVELAKQGEGIRIAFERLGRGDILDGLREATHGTVTDLELMKAAVKFNDFKLPVEELGTMLAFAQQKAKDTGQSVDYMVDSIVTGLGRKSLMILDNLGLSATEIKDRMKETGDMTKAVGAIIREQMAKAGNYVETAADRQAQATVNVQNKLEELGRKMQPLAEEGASMWNSIKLGGLSLISSVLDPMISRYTKLGLFMQQYGNLGGSGKVGQMLKQLGSGGGRAESVYQQQTAQFWKYINPREEYLKALSRWRKGERSDQLQQTINQGRERFGIDDRAIRAQVDAAKKQLKEYQEGAKSILNPIKPLGDIKDTNNSLDDLKKKLKDLEEQRKKAIAAGDTDLSKSLLKEINQTKADIRGLDPNALKTTTTKKEQTEIQKNQAEIAKLTQEYVKLGDVETEASRKHQAEIQKEIERLQKLNGLMAIRAEKAQGRLLLRAGDVASASKNVSGVGALDQATNYGKSIAVPSGGLQLSDKAMNSVQKNISKQLKDVDGLADKWGSVSSAISAVGNAMAAVEDPAAKVLGIVAQAIATVALTFAKSLSGTITPWDWIAAAAAGTATMISTISAIHSATGYAEGGIIKGNSYSGDNLMAMGPNGLIGLNAGEIVLNKSQQNNLASQLQGGGMQNLNLTATIKGEQIRLALNNNGRRTGRGEYVQSRNVR